MWSGKGEEKDLVAQKLPALYIHTSASLSHPSPDPPPVSKGND